METQPDEIEEVRRLFHQHVPEVASGVVEITGIVRNRGERTIVAIHSHDPSIDPVGSCVGERGIRVKTIGRELQGEKLDLVRWSDSLETFLTHLVAPAKVEGVILNEVARHAIIFTNPDQKALARGRDGSRLKLISRLVGWELQIESG